MRLDSFDDYTSAFLSMKPSDLTDLTEEEEEHLQIAGLAQIIRPPKETPPYVRSVNAEKLLYLVSSCDLRYEVALHLLNAASDMDMLYIHEKTTTTIHRTQIEDDYYEEEEEEDVEATRVLKGIPGQFANEIDELQRQVDALPEVGSRSTLAICMGVVAILFGLAALVLFNPTIAAWMAITEAPDWFTTICALVFIAVLFTAGFWAAMALTVFLALMVGLPLVRKGVILLVLGVLAVFFIYLCIEQVKLLQVKDAEEIYNKGVRSIKAKMSGIQAFGDRLFRNIDNLIQDDEKKAKRLDVDDRREHFKVHDYLSLYRNELKSRLDKLKESVAKL